MFSERSKNKFGADLYNLNRTRNPLNTDHWDYNCGGYALGTISWYLPSRDYVWGFWEEWTKETIQKLTKEAVQVMLEDFTDLRVIQRLGEVRHDEYAIAFRISSDGDFHYIKQGKARTWTHKCGSGRIRTMTRWEVLNTDWNNRYNGPIVLFAKKRA